MKKILLSISCLCAATIMNAQTPSLTWAKAFIGFNAGKSTAVDATGNVYTVGYFEYTVDFDPSVATYTMAVTPFMQQNMFITKLDASGNFVWAKQINSDGGADDIYSVAVDVTGNVYVSGIFSSGNSTDFDPGSATYYLPGYLESTFILKLNAAGNFVWAKSLDGTVPGSRVVGNSMALDVSGNIYTTGILNGTADFDPGTPTYTILSNGGDDVFISKIDGSGNFVWAKNLGGYNNETVNSIAVDVLNNVYTVGSFSNTADFDPNGTNYTLTSAGNEDIFISKLDASGNFVWAKSIGGVDADNGMEITVDAANNVYTTGRYKGSVDFNPGSGVFTLTGFSSSFQYYALKLNTVGNFVWAKIMGTSANAITTDVLANVYMAGDYCCGADLNPNSGVFTLSPNGSYVSKLDSAGNFIWGSLIAADVSTQSMLNSIAIDASFNIHTTGHFYDGEDFDPSINTYTIATLNKSTFVHKMAPPVGGSGVGIKESYLSSNLSIYPNPTNGILNVTLVTELVTEALEVTITNALGQVVLTDKATSNNITLKTDNLITGLYFVNVTDSKGNKAVQKIIKE